MRIPIATRIKSDWFVFIWSFKIIRLQEIKMLNETSFVKTTLHFLSLLFPPRYNFIMEMTVCCPQLCWVEVVSSLDVPEAFPYVVDTARYRFKIKLRIHDNLTCISRHVICIITVFSVPFLLFKVISVLDKLLAEVIGFYLIPFECR